MPRCTLISVAVVLAALGPAVSGAAAKPMPLAQAVLESCESALDRSSREAVFEGRMRALRGAVRLQQRFTLEQLSSDGDAWSAVDAPGFDEWKTADPGVRRYVLTKGIGNLAAPASYRVTVRFRWVDLTGRVLLRRKLVSPVCKQLDMRPDLRVTRIDVAPGVDPARTRYSVSLRNSGRTAADPFELVLNVDGADRPAVLVGTLGAGDRALVDFVAPACSATSALVATADAGTQVDEALESNNAFGRLCPFSAA